MDMDRRSDFDKRWKSMEKQGNRIRLMAWFVTAFTIALMAAMLVGSIYVLAHPEMFGRFASRVMAGYEERQP